MELGAEPSPLDTLPAHWVGWWGFGFPARLFCVGV